MIAPAKRSILVLYCSRSNQTSAILEHLEAFTRYSRHSILFVDAVGKAELEFDLNSFDAVVVHYSVRLSIPDHLSPSFAAGLAAYKGAKFLFIQDEYDSTETARRWMERLQFSVVFTCVADRDVDKVYPRSRFPRTRFINNLTGYVPDRLIGLPRKPIRDRKNWVAYRGRALHPVYGELGWEKQFIGEEFKKRALENGWPVDIEWLDERRIYGDSWYDFLGSARATLGTESGSNLFDIEGTLRTEIDRRLGHDRNLTYRTIYNDLLKDLEGQHGHMNQVSPKIFEAIALGTVLVLFEGGYSNVLVPNRHYVPLKKDFSNFDEVAALLADPAKLQQIADQAYDEIVASGRFSFKVLISQLDACIEELTAPPKNQWQVATVAVALYDGTGEQRPLFITRASNAPSTLAVRHQTIESVEHAENLRLPLYRAVVRKGYPALVRRAFRRFLLSPLYFANQLYHFLPESVKSSLRPTVKRVRRAFGV
jgi:hypothetical protein